VLLLTTLRAAAAAAAAVEVAESGHLLDTIDAVCENVKTSRTQRQHRM